MQENFISHFISLLSSTSDYIYFKDRNYKFLLCSQNFADITGQDSWRELAGKDDFDVFPHEHALAYRQEDAKIIEGGEQEIVKIEPYEDQDGNKL